MKRKLISKKNKLHRVYRQVYDWEEMKFNMWGSIENKEECINKAIEFMNNTSLFGIWMNKVIDNWIVSCENALTDYSMNRIAWLGQAAVAYALQIPENITRTAWSKLNEKRQLLANGESERAILRWEVNYRKNKKIYNYLEEKMLSC
jgi:hypothetical protein